MIKPKFRTKKRKGKSAGEEFTELAIEMHSLQRNIEDKNSWADRTIELDFKDNGKTISDNPRRYAAILNAKEDYAFTKDIMNEFKSDKFNNIMYEEYADIVAEGLIVKNGNKYTSKENTKHETKRKIDKKATAIAVRLLESAQHHILYRGMRVEQDWKYQTVSGKKTSTPLPRYTKLTATPTNLIEDGDLYNAIQVNVYGARKQGKKKIDTIE